MVCSPDVDVWLQSRFLPARGRVGLEVHRCLCLIDAGNVFISTFGVVPLTLLASAGGVVAASKRPFLLSAPPCCVSTSFFIQGAIQYT